MALGNELLWSPANRNHPDHAVESESRLEQALRYFGHAGDLVLEQQAAHKASIEGTNDITLEGRFVQRNLVLLRGQACVNRGIVLVEHSRMKDTKLALKQKLMSQAMLELKDAEKCASDLRRLSKSHQNEAFHGSKDWVEIFLDKLKADELESLTFRWKATGQWQFNRQESHQLFSRASGFFFSTVADEIIRGNQVLLFKLLEIGVGCIQSNNVLSDLSCSVVEQMVGARQQVSKKATCEEHIENVKTALQKNSEISKAIASLASRSSFGSDIRSFQEDQEILSPEQYVASKNEIVAWWEDVKNRPTSVERTAGRPEDLPRNDLMSQGRPMPRLSSDATQRFTIDGTVSKRQQQRNQSSSSRGGGRGGFGKGTSASRRSSATYDGDDSFDAVFALADNDDPNQSVAASKPLVFRKWGDQLLPQEVVNPETGETRAKLVYPAIAPEMPPEIKALLGITTG